MFCMLCFVRRDLQLSVCDSSGAQPRLPLVWLLTEEIPWAKAPLFMFGLWLPGERSPLQSLLSPCAVPGGLAAVSSVLTVSLSPVCSPPACSCLRRRQLERPEGVPIPSVPRALAVLGGHSCAAIPALSVCPCFPWQPWAAGGVPSPAPPASSSCLSIQMCECDEVQKSKLAPERP